MQRHSHAPNVNVAAVSQYRGEEPQCVVPRHPTTATIASMNMNLCHDSASNPNARFIVPTISDVFCQATRTRLPICPPRTNAPTTQPQYRSPPMPPRASFHAHDAMAPATGYADASSLMVKTRQRLRSAETGQATSSALARTHSDASRYSPSWLVRRTGMRRARQRWFPGVSVLQKLSELVCLN